MAELVVAGKGKLESDTKSLDRHDRDGANGRADRKVNNRVSLAIDWGDPVDHEDGESNNSEGVEQEAYSQG
jgi:hypothetical protein